jgi:hypothetical protein
MQNSTSLVGTWRSAAWLSVSLVALSLPGCVFPLVADDSATAANQGGGSVKADDVYAATMALIGATQLVGLIDGETTVSDEAASAVASRMRTRLASATCLAVGGQGASVTIDFKSGCTLPGSPIPLTGKATVSASIVGAAAARTLVLDVALDDFGAGGKTATGGATLTVRAANDGLDVDLTMKMLSGDAALSGGMHVDVMLDKTTAKTTKIVFSTLPDTMVVSGATALSVDASAVTFAAGDCYPSAGSIVFTSAGLKATLAFDSETTQSGEAQMTPPLSKKSEPLPLPGRGWKCG